MGASDTDTNRKTGGGMTPARTNYRRHRMPLTAHLVESMNVDSDTQGVQIAIALRIIREGLQKVGISLGADDELSAEEKGAMLSSVSLLSVSITEAFEADASRGGAATKNISGLPSAGPKLQKLSRG